MFGVRKTDLGEWRREAKRRGLAKYLAVTDGAPGDSLPHVAETTPATGGTAAPQMWAAMYCLDSHGSSSVYSVASSSVQGGQRLDCG